MNSDTEPKKYAEDLALAEACANGASDAFRKLREYEPFLVGILRNRGALELEARDIIQNLWGDCVPRENSEKPNLMSRYSGTSALTTWLATVATNRLIDSKRRRKIETVEDSVEEEKFGKYASTYAAAYGNEVSAALTLVIGASK